MAKEDEWDWGVNTFDSREMIERIEYIEGELDIADDEDGQEEEPYLTTEEQEDLKTELDALREFAAQASGYGDWNGGTTVIADDYFVSYAEEYAESLDLVTTEAAWPYSNIDWDSAADDLRQDYTAIEHDEQTWWLR